jgi:hypothetical protein
MSEPTDATLLPKQVETSLHRFSEFSQATSDVGDEVSKGPIVLDYNRVAARFYEDQIIGLRRELEKYRAQVRTSGLERATTAGLISAGAQPVAVTGAFKAKMRTPVLDAESTPEEL